jgi:putative heme-binding domain-containing protein
LLGITFDRDRWMYVARGNVGSNAYRFQGPDDSMVAGYGDGGNVIRCRPDGTQISEVATGFWNPFDLKFDRSGRLLLVDNDPDARGPNRLLQVVEGGDYGYKSLFGGSGTHPFQGWDGSLPGTLPYIAGTGEAPSGLIDCRRSSLPIDYEHSVLATIWNENTIERFAIDPHTGNLQQKSVFMQGDQDFRPVALDCDSRGHLFVTDWVLVDYPNHGRGRIWRVSVKSNQASMKPEDYFAPYHRCEQLEKIEKLKRQGGSTLVTQLADTTGSDPLVRHATIMRLADAGMVAARERCLAGDAALRMAGLLASKRAEPDDGDLIVRLLSDPDPEIRRAALQWAAGSMQLSLADKLHTTLAVQPVTPEVFEAYLAAAEMLTPEFVSAYRSRSEVKSSNLPRRLDPSRLVAVATDPSLPASVRSLAIRRFDESIGREQEPMLRSLLKSPADELAVAAIDVLARQSNGSSDERVIQFLAIARDSGRSDVVRTFALAALETIPDFDPDQIESLSNNISQRVAIQSSRTISALRRGEERAGVRPTADQDWHSVLSSGGDPVLGRHVFYRKQVGCAKCHDMHGRGGTLGPGLSGVARSKSRKQIIDAILKPSANFAPQYQAWMVLTDDGTVHRGLQLDHKSKGAISLTLESGDERFFEADEIEAYRALPTSLMPTGLEKLMTVDEFRDLVAYLTTLRE